MNTARANSATTTFSAIIDDDAVDNHETNEASR
jgi:hypothetical protein